MLPLRVSAAGVSRARVILLLALSIAPAALCAQQSVRPARPDSAPRKGTGYQRDYAAEPGIGGLPFEKPDAYIQRSPLYHVDNEWYLRPSEDRSKKVQP